jgi:hypothetical protein
VKRNGTAPLSLPSNHPAWRRAAVKAAAAFGRRALRPADAVRAIGEACDCAHSLAREILAAGESFGLLMFTGGRWSAVTASGACGARGNPRISEARQAPTGGLQGANPCDSQ